MQTAIELMDGPLEGFHELQFGYPPPDKVGLPFTPGKLCWYEKNINGKYYFYSIEITDDNSERQV